MPEDNGNGAPRRLQPFWSGIITFGLVSIPVSLYVANRAGRVALRMVDEDGTPLVRAFFCSQDGEALEAEDIVRGYEVEKGQFVLVSDEELEAAAPEKSREIDLKRFVPLAQVDPVYFERAFLLAPDGGATKAYRLLARTLEETGRAGIATFVMRGKEYLVAIIGQQGLLRAETLRFRDEIRSPEAIGLPGLAEVPAVRRKDVEKRIRELSAKSVDREDLSDEHRRLLQALIEHKLEQGADVIEAPAGEEAEERESAEIIDLMQIIKERLGKPRSASQAERPATNGRGAARKPAANKARVPLATRSRSELYREAKELDIPGRSQMTRAQLIDAIRERR